MKNSTLRLVLLLFAIGIFTQGLHGQASTNLPPAPPERPKGKLTPDNYNVYSWVDENPQFPGGDGELLRFIQKNIQYPKMERDSNIEGKVQTRFVINEDGSVSDVKVLRSVSPGLDKEAARVVKMLPKFIPAQVDGKPVKIYFLLPVVFRLNNKH